jgi:very-short-patch-repair endonuclease
MPQFRPRQTKRAKALRNNATETERKLWRHLRKRQLGGFKFSRQMDVGPYVCDFLCRENGLVIELDGGQHATQTARDLKRTAFLNDQGLTVVRFWNNEIFENLEGVLQTILSTLENLPPRFARPNPPLPLAGGDEPRSGEGVGLSEAAQAHPQPPPASGRGLS